MTLRQLAGATLVALGAVTAFAVPASAEPNPNQEQIDQVFAKEVRERGFRISTGEAKDVAESTCDVLARGGTVEDALRHVQNATGWKSGKDVGALGSLAVQAYCPGAMPKA